MGVMSRNTCNALFLMPFKGVKDERMTDKLIKRIEDKIEAFSKDAEASENESYTARERTALYNAGKLDGMCDIMLDAGVPEDRAKEIKKKVAFLESKWLHDLCDARNRESAGKEKPSLQEKIKKKKHEIKSNQYEYKTTEKGGPEYGRD